MKDKNMEELLAAISGRTSNSPPANNTFSPSRNPINIPTAAIPQVTPPAAARARPAVMSDSVSKNLDSLYNLLGSNQTSAGASSVSPSQVPGYPNRAILTPVQQSMPTQSITPPHVASLGQPAVSTSQFQRKQAAGSKASIKRDSPIVTSASSSRAAAPSVSTNRPAARVPVRDIAAEITALQQNSSSTERARAQAARPTVSPAARHRAPASVVAKAAGAHLPGGAQIAQSPSNMVVANGQASSAQSSGVSGGTTQAPGAQRSRSQITQEQIIVGHFCRHAIKTLTTVMENKPNQKATETRLKEHIKTVWASWVKGMIGRSNLLESVAGFVRGSCPEAANLDVIKDFKVWYEREFELQKRRKAEGTLTQPPQQTQPRNLQHRQVRQRPRVGPPPDGRGQPSGTAAQLSAAARAQVHAAVAGRAQAIATGKAQVVGTAAGQVTAFPQGNRTGGKSISNKTVVARKTPMAKGVRGTGPKGTATKSIANKSVGSKSVPRPAVASSVGQIGIKGPSASAGLVGSKGSLGGKGITGSKSLVGTKGMVGLKGKGVRKPVGKTASKPQPKAPPKGGQKMTSKVLPKSVAKQNPALVMTGVGAGNGVGSFGVTGKRPLDMTTLSPGSMLKKTKVAVKPLKGNVGRKKMAVSGLSMTKGGKPPPARSEIPKARPAAGPTGLLGAPGGVEASAAMAGTGPAGTNVPLTKKVRRFDDELNVYHNVVDIENEEDMLGRDAGGGMVEEVEHLSYDSDMLLAGPKLRTKMNGICNRFGMADGIPKEVLEMVSLAARERLSSMLEELKSIAKVRCGANKAGWKTELVGPNVHEKLERMREDEERSLTVAAEMRIKRKKDQEEREAKKLAGEAAQEEKKAKDSSATADAERKEKIALEKKRKENSSQRDALSGLLAKVERRKRPNSTKGLAPLDSLAPLGPLKGLLPITRRANSESISGKSGAKLTTAQQLERLGPLTKLGGPRMSSMPGSKSGPNKVVTIAKTPLNLRDCIFLAESEKNMRKSVLLYKWYARLGPSVSR